MDYAEEQEISELKYAEKRAERVYLSLLEYAKKRKNVSDGILYDSKFKEAFIIGVSSAILEAKLIGEVKGKKMKLEELFETLNITFDPKS